MAEGILNKMMKQLMTSVVAGALLASAILTTGIAPSQAHDYQVKELSVIHPWARPTPGKLRVTAAYMVLANDSKEAEKLVTVKTDIAERIEIHESLVKDGKAIMRPLKDGLALPAGDIVELAPKGLHLMVMGLKKPLAKGDTIPMTLTFANRGDVKIKVKVEQGSGDHDHSDHDHSKHGQDHKH